ncbi:MAG: tetratricopeptide repeat protein [Anaerolineae bacterium]
MVLFALAGGGYLVYRLVGGLDPSDLPGNLDFIESLGFTGVSYPTPTPVPTATPTAGFYVSQAEDAYWQGSMGEALSAYQQALDREPNQVHLYLELASLLTYYGQPERGLEMARQAVVRQPENARAWALLGMAYDWLGLTEQAVIFCEKAVELDPTLPEAYAYLAEAYIDDGQWYAANEAIATALQLDAENVVVLRNQAYVMENQGNYTAAIAGYRDALEINDRLVHLYIAMGRNYGALGNLLSARSAFEDAVEVDPQHAMALDRLGWTQLLLGDYESARENLTAALEQDPNSADAHGHLATLYFHQRNYEDAIELFGPAIRLGEARSRRRTVLFLITEEDINAVGAEPEGDEVAYAQFVHPSELQTPMRGEFKAVDGGASVQGQIRFDVMSGRYQLSVSSLPPSPSGKVYIGWFLQLFYPEGTVVRTEPIYPAPDGLVEMSGETGTVKGPPIENYYNYALSHYLLDQCDQARPMIEIALRIDPEDANARRTLELCQ